MKCNHCGKEIDSSWGFCPFCGGASSKKKCPSCGEELLAGFKVCPMCGLIVKGIENGVYAYENKKNNDVDNTVVYKLKSGQLIMQTLDSLGRLTNPPLSKEQRREVQEITLPKNIKSIEEESGNEMYYVEKIYYDGTVRDWCNIKIKSSFMCGKTQLIFKGKVIEDLVFDFPLHTIQKHCFGGCKSIRSVKIVSSVKVIDAWAFSNCVNLKQVEIGDSLEVIEHDAFAYCERLTDLSLGKGIKRIGDVAFRNCRMSKVVIPDNCETIEGSAFFDCPIYEVIVGKNCKNVDRAFDGCRYLRKITFGPYCDASYSLFAWAYSKSFIVRAPQGCPAAKKAKEKGFKVEYI